MKAITVEPKKPETARYMEMPEPDLRDGSVLVEAIAVGVCGTDVEIVESKYGWSAGSRLSRQPCMQFACKAGHDSQVVLFRQP